MHQPDLRIFKSLDEIYRAPTQGVDVFRDIDTGGFRVSIASYDSTCSFGKLAKAWSSIEFELGGQGLEHYGAVDREVAPGAILTYEPNVEHWTVKQTNAIRVCQIGTKDMLDASRINIPILSSFLFRIYRQLINMDSATSLPVESMCCEMQEHLRAGYR